MADEEALGPISYLIVEFPGTKMSGEGFPILMDLVDRGLIRILDLLFVTKSLDGTIESIELGDVDHDGKFDFAILEGAAAGLLDEEDMAEAASAIEPGTAAGILIFENRWARSFVQALQRNGAGLIAAGYIPQDALLSALDSTESH